MIADILHKLAGQFQEEEHDYYPRPSLAGPERCIRQMVYWGMKMPRDPLPGRTLFVFDDSTWHEELTFNWLRQSPFKPNSEQMKIRIVAPVSVVALPEEFLVLEGSIDGIVTDLMEVDRLIEHKAINHFSFQKYWDKEELPLDYITQTCLYLRGLNVINPELKEAILLIKNKNTSAYLEYLIEYDYRADAAFIVNKINSNGEKIDIKESIEHITAWAFEKFARVQARIDNKILPDRQYDQDHWRCQYCGWSRTCWEGWESEIEAMAVDGMLPEELATAVQYYQELGGQNSGIKKERDGLSDQIKKAMKNVGIRQGRTGEYVCEIKLEHREERVQEAKTIEKLYVKKIKEG